MTFVVLLNKTKVCQIGLYGKLLSYCCFVIQLACSLVSKDAPIHSTNSNGPVLPPKAWRHGWRWLPHPYKSTPPPLSSSSMTECFLPHCLAQDRQRGYFQLGQHGTAQGCKRLTIPLRKRTRREPFDNQRMQERRDRISSWIHWFGSGFVLCILLSSLERLSQSFAWLCWSCCATPPPPSSKVTTSLWDASHRCLSTIVPILITSHHVVFNN